MCPSSRIIVHVRGRNCKVGLFVVEKREKEMSAV